MRLYTQQSSLQSSYAYPLLVSGYCKAPETGASRSPLVLPGRVSVPPSLFGPVQTPSIATPRGCSLHVADCVMRFDCADNPGLFLCNDDCECFILCHCLTLFWLMMTKIYTHQGRVQYPGRNIFNQMSRMVGTGLAWQTDDCGNARRMIAGRGQRVNRRIVQSDPAPGRGHSPGEGARGSPSMSI